MQLPQGVLLDIGPGGLQRLSISTPHADAQLYLHGAHLSHYQPKDGRPILWVSRQSQFVGAVNSPRTITPGKAIRGGVPICFPWFGPKAGDPAAPLHGVARVLPWTLESVACAPDGRITAALSLSANDFTRSVFPHDFAARFTATIGPALTMTLTIRNPGAAAFTFEEALHTYLAVSDVRQVGLTGLAGAAYVERTDKLSRKSQDARAITINAETDRVYLGTRAAVTVHDPGWRRRLVLDKAGSDTTVVWNPWVAKAKAMPDLGDDEWPEMLCVETANAGENAVTLAPGAEHTLGATIRVEAL